MNDEPLIRQSHAQWHLVEGKAVASMLDGRSIFAWRNEYMELAARFVEYADHTAACYSARDGHVHPHLPMTVSCATWHRARVGCSSYSAYSTPPSRTAYTALMCLRHCLRARFSTTTAHRCTLRHARI
jgi:hypothetical protein